MAVSLKGAINQPVYTQSSILQGLRSPKGQKIVWVVVEDQEDKMLYEKFSDISCSTIKTSEDEEGRKGCEKVEQIVSHVRSLGHENVIGIRDADYIRYQEVPYNLPDGVFVTDVRDLELMLLEAESVVSSMSSIISEFKSIMQECKSICRLAGYARIMNHVQNLGCNFKRKAKISKIWNHNDHSLIPDWENIYKNIFISACNPEKEVSLADFQTFVDTHYLTQEKDCDICQGHDLLDVFSYKMVRNEFAQDKMVYLMIQCYTFEDFQKTNLYVQTRNYAQDNGLTLWQS